MMQRCTQPSPSTYQYIIGGSSVETTMVFPFYVLLLETLPPRTWAYPRAQRALQDRPGLVRDGRIPPARWG